MKKYEKFIAITLIFIMLFNIIDYKKVDADMDNITKAGLIAFLITMNIYNVATNTTNAVMTLFNEFWSNKSNTERNEFVDSFKTVWKNSFTSGIVSVAAMPYIHNWVREQFKEGYNEYVKEYGYENDLEGTRIELYQNSPHVKYFSMSSGGTSYYINGYGVQVVLGYNGNPTKLYYHDGTVVTEGSVSSEFLERNGWISFHFSTSQDRIELKVYLVNSTPYKQISWKQNQVYYPKPDYNKVTEYYYAGEAVDYPMERDVEDKYIPLPVPDVGMGIPGLDYDVGENKVFDGTVDQFLDEVLGNADYLDSTIDKLLEGGYSTSLPNVNVDSGTITWPVTGSVSYPDTGVIEYPDITIPEGVEEGIGETNSILQGIGSFVESMFSAPTVELDLSPLTNVNLKEKFPFCLPFDLATLLTGLKSDEKEAPNFDFEFEVLNDQYTIPIDFELFNDWAIIVNWFVLILFIIGLILITRRLIGG